MTKENRGWLVGRKPGNSKGLAEQREDAFVGEAERCWLSACRGGTYMCVCMYGHSIKQSPRLSCNRVRRQVPCCRCYTCVLRCLPKRDPPQSSKASRVHLVDEWKTLNSFATAGFLFCRFSLQPLLRSTCWRSVGRAALMRTDRKWLLLCAR